MILSAKIQLTNLIQTSTLKSIVQTSSTNLFKHNSQYAIERRAYSTESRRKLFTNSFASLARFLRSCVSNCNYWSSSSPKTTSSTYASLSSSSTLFKWNLLFLFSKRSRDYLDNVKTLLERLKRHRRLQVLLRKTSNSNRYFLCSLTPTLGLFSWDKYKISDDDIKSEVDEILSMFTMEKRDDGARIHIDLEKSRHYEDDQWKLIYDKPDLIIWRRAIVLSESDSGESQHTSHSHEIYEYKVLGRINDSTPIEFYKTQVDLNYRQEWDYLVLHLDLVDKHVDTNTELIRWIMRFPYPLYPREYVFVRRFCMDPDEGLLILVSRAIPECRIDLVAMHHHLHQQQKQHDNHGEDNHADLKDNHHAHPHPNPNPNHHQQQHHQHQNQHQHQQPSAPKNSSSMIGVGSGGSSSSSSSHYVRVVKFKSNIIIMPHSDLDKPGLNYVIQYYDINKAKIPKIAYKWMATSGLPDFVDKLQAAAHKLKRKYESAGVNELELLKDVDSVYVYRKTPPLLPAVITPQTTTQSEEPTTTNSNEQTRMTSEKNSASLIKAILDRMAKKRKHDKLLQRAIDEFFNDEPHPVFTNY